MGVQLGSLIRGNDLDIKSLAGRSVGIDAFNWLYQFLSIIRDKDTGQPLMDSKGRVTSHLSGLFYRTIRLLEAGIRPVYVFDGRPPEFKARTSEERREVRARAEQEWKLAVAKGRMEEARKAAQVAVRLTGDMIEQSKLLLGRMGVQVVQAPSEGEAQAAVMARKKLIWASASQDWDSLLFGSPRLVRNLSVAGKRKVPGKEAYVEVSPELLELEHVLAGLGITQEQLITLGLLVGTDFNPGVKGIGPKTALKIVKEEKTLEKAVTRAALKSRWEGPDPKDIMDFFLQPPAKEVELKAPPFDADGIMRLMVDEHEFSSERIEKALERIRKERPGKHSLGSWLK